MVTPEDSATTYEYDRHYIVYPQITFNSRQQPGIGGTLVKEGFSYSSGSNSEWLSVEEIRERLVQLGMMP